MPRGKPDARIRKATLMRVSIAGAGNIGQSIAHAVLSAGHKVLLIERQRPHYRPALVPEADWMLADACELAALEAAGIHTADVVIAATGDDKVNLVFALLCKTEFAVPRVVARVTTPVTNGCSPNNGESTSPYPHRAPSSSPPSWPSAGVRSSG